MINRKLYLCGPGRVQFTPPPGTLAFDLEMSKSGHLLLPVSHFLGNGQDAKVRERQKPASWHSRDVEPPDLPATPEGAGPDPAPDPTATPSGPGKGYRNRTLQLPQSACAAEQNRSPRVKDRAPDCPPHDSPPDPLAAPLPVVH